jgi:hypothetical protein
MVKKRKKKSFDDLPEIELEEDIQTYLEKVGNTIFATFKKYNIPPNPIGEWGLLSQANSQEFWKRILEIQEEFHQKKIPQPLDLVQAQAILPHLTKAGKSLVQGNCEELAYHVGSIVRDFCWPNKYQPRLAGQQKRGKLSPLTQGLIQLIQYAEGSPKDYTAEKMLGLVEILANDDRFTDLNCLELGPKPREPKIYTNRTYGKKEEISNVEQVEYQR